MTADPQSFTVRVPLTIQRRGGRKLVITQAGEAGGVSTPPGRRVDSTLVKALARAHRWKRLLEEGRYASISEMAAAERIDRGYLGRILQLTLLAPDIVEAILDGLMPAGLGLPELLKPFPLLWERQRSMWLIATGRSQAAACVSSQPPATGRAIDPDAPKPAWMSI